MNHPKGLPLILLVFWLVSSTFPAHAEATAHDLHVVSPSSGLLSGTFPNPDFVIATIGIEFAEERGSEQIYRVHVPILNTGASGPGTLRLWTNGASIDVSLYLNSSELSTVVAQYSLSADLPFDVRPSIVGFVGHNSSPSCTLLDPPEFPFGGPITPKPFTVPGTLQVISSGPGGRFWATINNNHFVGPCYVNAPHETGPLSSVSCVEAGE